MTYLLIIILCIIIAALYFFIIRVKHRLLYYPESHNEIKYNKFYSQLESLTGHNKLIKKYTIQTPDLINLDLTHVKNPDTNICIIFFHGNAGNISSRYEVIKFLYNYGSVVIFDYRSYGASENAPLNCTGLQTDSQTAWSFTKNNLITTSDKISLYGESLGCYFAIDLAHKLSQLPHNDGLHSVVLNAPFYSLNSMVKSISNKLGIGMIGYIIAHYFGNDHDSASLISKISPDIPIVFSHSIYDTVIPYSQAVQLYKKTTNSKFITIPGNHCDMQITDEYLYTLASLYED